MSPKAGTQTFIYIKRGNKITGVIPAYWAWNAEGKLIKVTVPKTDDETRINMYRKLCR
jgi:hypothetical protein